MKKLEKTHESIVSGWESVCAFVATRKLDNEEIFESLKDEATKRLLDANKKCCLIEEKALQPFSSAYEEMRLSLNGEISGLVQNRSSFHQFALHAVMRFARGIKNDQLVDFTKKLVEQYVESRREKGLSVGNELANFSENVSDSVFQVSEKPESTSHVRAYLDKEYDWAVKCLETKKEARKKTKRHSVFTRRQELCLGKFLEHHRFEVGMKFGDELNTNPISQESLGIESKTSKDTANKFIANAFPKGGDKAYKTACNSPSGLLYELRRLAGDLPSLQSLDELQGLLKEKEMPED